MIRRDKHLQPHIRENRPSERSSRPCIDKRPPVAPNAPVKRPETSSRQLFSSQRDLSLSTSWLMEVDVDLLSIQSEIGFHYTLFRSFGTAHWSLARIDIQKDK
jgi:hypothetical protein